MLLMLFLRRCSVAIIISGSLGSRVSLSARRILQSGRNSTAFHASQRTRLFQDSDHRRQTPSIVFGIFTSEYADLEEKSDQFERLNAQLDTWAKDLPHDEILIVGRTPPSGKQHIATWDPAANCGDAPPPSLSVACKEATVIANAYHMDADWVVVLGDDNYAVTANVKAALRNYDPGIPVILGCVGCDANDPCTDGLCGGCGEIVSRAAMELMLMEGRNKFLAEHGAAAAGPCDFWSDQSTSYVAKVHNVTLRDMEGLYGWRHEISALGPLSEPEDETFELTIGPDQVSPLIYHYVTPLEMLYMHDTFKQIQQNSNMPAFLQASDGPRAIEKRYENNRDEWIQRVNQIRLATK